VIVSIPRAYDASPEGWRHPLPEITLWALAAAVAVLCWPAGSRVTLGVALAVVAATVVGVIADPWWWRGVAVAGIVIGGGAWRADAEWGGAHPARLGHFEGWAAVVGDPQPSPTVTRVVLELDGERFEYWARSRAKRVRVDAWASGDRLLLSGARAPISPSRQDRVAWQHVVGQFELDWVAERRPGSPIDRASNRVRALLASGASTLPNDDAALFRGLVIGDDSDQPVAMLDRFRASGLSHLTAVSGQNVAFVLAAAGPILRRMRSRSRWAVTIGLIAWFVALTRFEPSIVRAGAMAALSATAFALGRQRAPSRLLALAVIVLLLIDPLLVRSVGFLLSVGATAGVTLLAGPLAERLARLRWLAAPLAVTLAAQLGVAIPALLVFGRLPLVSIPANLLAVPVAGAVMLYGLPAGLLAGAVPPLAPALMFPCRLGVRWVDTVAALGARLEPGEDATWAGWLVVLGAVGVVAVAGPGKNRARHERASADR
jgi:competence protein ComEC